MEKMKPAMPRRAGVSLVYNGVSAAGQVAPFLNSFQYNDIASGSSDSISITFNDRDHKWIGPWFPVKGDILQPTIIVENWTGDGAKSFFCGSFGVDDFSFSGGPIQLKIEALALPGKSGFKTERRTETYESTTIAGIGAAIADRAGISLFFDAPDFAIEKIEQNEESDCGFYCEIVEKYGLALKIYNDRLVVFSEEEYEAKDPKCVLTPRDFEPGWSWNTKQEGTYTGVKYQYTNSDKNKTFTVEAGTPERLLACSETADNLTEATAIALAALNNANKGATTMSITMMARPGLIASDCVQISGLQRLDGKYYIDRITHSVGSGYKMALDLRLVEPRILNVTAVSSDVSEAGSPLQGG